jgi:hypothetical protein
VSITSLLCLRHHATEPLPTIVFLHEYSYTSIPTRVFLHEYSYTSMHSSRTRTSEPRRGLWYFVRHNVTVWVALFTSLACIVATIIFTTWLSNQVLRCLTWSTSCSVSYRVENIRNSIGTVQGLVTAVYVIGMASVAYAAHSLAESAL